MLRFFGFDILYHKAVYPSCPLTEHIEILTCVLAGGLQLLTNFLSSFLRRQNRVWGFNTLWRLFLGLRKGKFFQQCGWKEWPLVKISVSRKHVTKGSTFPECFKFVLSLSSVCCSLAPSTKVGVFCFCVKLTHFLLKLKKNVKYLQFGLLAMELSALSSFFALWFLQPNYLEQRLVGHQNTTFEPRLFRVLLAAVHLPALRAKKL